MFEKIKNWYIQDFWNEKMLRKVCEKGAITEEQINEILELKISLQKQFEEQNTVQENLSDESIEQNDFFDEELEQENLFDEELEQENLFDEDLELRGQDE